MWSAKHTQSEWRWKTKIGTNGIHGMRTAFGTHAVLAGGFFGNRGGVKGRGRGYRGVGGKFLAFPGHRHHRESRARQCSRRPRPRHGGPAPVHDIWPNANRRTRRSARVSTHVVFRAPSFRRRKQPHVPSAISHARFYPFFVTVCRPRVPIVPVVVVRPETSTATPKSKEQ